MRLLKPREVVALLQDLKDRVSALEVLVKKPAPKDPTPDKALEARVEVIEKAMAEAKAAKPKAAKAAKDKAAKPKA